MGDESLDIRKMAEDCAEGKRQLVGRNEGFWQRIISIFDECEQLRVQLAGCSVAALGGTDDPATQGDYGWSASYQDVLELRLKCDRYRKVLELCKPYVPRDFWNDLELRYVASEPGMAISEAEQPPADPTVPELRPFERRAADALARAVARLVQNGRLDSRSEARDALLSYMNVGGVNGPKSVPEWLDQHHPEPGTVPELLERWRSRSHHNVAARGDAMAAKLQELSRPPSDVSVAELLERAGKTAARLQTAGSNKDADILIAMAAKLQELELDHRLARERWARGMHDREAKAWHAEQRAEELQQGLNEAVAREDKEHERAEAAEKNANDLSEALDGAIKDRDYYEKQMEAAERAIDEHDRNAVESMELHQAAERGLAYLRDIVLIETDTIAEELDAEIAKAMKGDGPTD